MTTTATGLSLAVLWTQPGCGPCIAAKRMLDAAGVMYVTLDVSFADADKIARWERMLGPGRKPSTPIIEAGGLVIFGADPDRIAALA